MPNKNINGKIQVVHKSENNSTASRMTVKPR